MLTCQWFWVWGLVSSWKGKICKWIQDRVALSRVAAMWMEKREWKGDSSEADAPSLWPLVLDVCAGGWWAFCQCYPRERSPSLPCFSFNAKIPARDVAEKHSKNHNSESLKVLSDLIIPFCSACRKGSSWWLDNPRKDVLALDVNAFNR